MTVHDEQTSLHSDYTLDHIYGDGYVLNIKCNQIHPDSIILAVVTKTPLWNGIDAQLTEDLRPRNPGFKKANEDIADLLLYWILERHGHTWAAIAKILPSNNG